MNTPRTMKKFVLLLTLALLTAPDLLAQAPKLGHIDRQQLMLMLPERKEAETKMQAFADQLKKRLDAMAQEYQQKLADAQATEATMTNTEKEIALRELAELEERIGVAQEKAQQDLAKQEEELLRPMVERTNQAIKDVAQENGFTYILDVSTGFVLYYDGGQDVLPLVKTKLGL